MPWFEAALPLVENPFLACDTRYQIGLAHVFLGEDARAAMRFDEALAHTPVAQLLDDLGDDTRAMKLADEVIARHEDHAEATTLWFEIALDELKQLDDVVEMASSIATEAQARATRMVSEVLRRDAAHVGALALQGRLRA